MPQRCMFTLTPTTPDPLSRERCAALLKLADGPSTSAVSRGGLLRPRPPDTVYGWLDYYQDQGLPVWNEHER
jgi:hypothetical protein